MTSFSAQAGKREKRAESIRKKDFIPHLFPRIAVERKKKKAIAPGLLVMVGGGGGVGSLLACLNRR